MYLGLDLGTTNIKALMVEADGRVIAEASRPVQLFHVENGGVEQDLEEIWQATLAVLREVALKRGSAAVRAIGVSSQGGAMQLEDAGGRALGRVISWLDGRGQTCNEAITRELGRTWFAERVGHPGAAVAIGQLLRLRAEAPDRLRPPNRIGFVGDRIVGRLCGRAAHDGTSAGITLLYNPSRRAYEPELLARLGLEAGQLPELLPARSPAGGLACEVARVTGLPEGAPVSPAVHDQYAAALATGATRAGAVMVGAGTAWVLLAVNDRALPPLSEDAFACHHLEAGLFGQILPLRNGGAALKWALELMGMADAGPEQIESLLAAAPPGCDGLRCWPFLAFTPAGVRAGTHGRFDGLKLAHKPAHVARAVVEGLALELARHLAALREGGCAVRELVMGGGAAASAVTTQILADVTGLPVRCFSGGGSALGAAILARGLLEPQRSLAELAAEMSRATRRAQPGADAPLYAQLFEEFLRQLPTEKSLPSARDAGSATRC